MCFLKCFLSSSRNLDFVVFNVLFPLLSGLSGKHVNDIIFFIQFIYFPWSNDGIMGERGGKIDFSHFELHVCLSSQPDKKMHFKNIESLSSLNLFSLCFYRELADTKIRRKKLFVRCNKSSFDLSKKREQLAALALKDLKRLIIFWWCCRKCDATSITGWLWDSLSSACETC